MTTHTSEGKLLFKTLANETLAKRPDTRADEAWIKILAKAAYRTNLLLCWIPIVVSDNSEARAAQATRSTLRPLELARVSKLHITPHKMTPLYRYSLRTLIEY